MRNYFHPDQPGLKPLTQPQLDLLRQIVATNGGGICQSKANPRVIKGLIDRHMIQGKSGNGSCMVHTTIGLAFIRQADAAERAGVHRRGGEVENEC